MTSFDGDNYTSDWPDVVVYRIGPIYASVCTKLDDEATTSFLNEYEPSGISTDWAVSEDEHFHTGQTNPCECHDDPERRHVLFSC